MYRFFKSFKADPYIKAFSGYVIQHVGFPQCSIVFRTAYWGSGTDLCKKQPLPVERWILPTLQAWRFLPIVWFE